MHETFWTLLHDAAHWEFEIFLMLLFDGLLFGLLWPFVRKHWSHHVARDRRDTIYGRDLGATIIARAQKTLALAQQNKSVTTPEGICDGCGGVKKTLPGSQLCVGCGEVCVLSHWQSQGDGFHGE